MSVDLTPNVTRPGTDRESMSLKPEMSGASDHILSGVSVVEFDWE